MTTGVVLDRKLELVLALLMPENALVARVMLSTGLRVGDVLELTPAQIKPSVRVRERKTGKSRTVRIPKALCARRVAAGRGLLGFSITARSLQAPDSSGRVGGHQASAAGVPLHGQSRHALHAQGVCPSS